MKRIKLLVPLLVGTTHREEGYEFDAPDQRAGDLIKAKHAVRVAEKADRPALETASIHPAPRKAAKVAGKIE